MSLKENRSLYDFIRFFCCVIELRQYVMDDPYIVDISYLVNDDCHRAVNVRSLGRSAMRINDCTRLSICYTGFPASIGKTNQIKYIVKLSLMLIYFTMTQ